MDYYDRWDEAGAADWSSRAPARRSAGPGCAALLLATVVSAAAWGVLLWVLVF